VTEADIQQEIDEEMRKRFETCLDGIIKGKGPGKVRIILEPTEYSPKLSTK